MTYILFENQGEIVIGIDQYKLFQVHFEESNQKFDYNISKNEIYINHENIDEKNRIIAIITELIENNGKSKESFIIELLERLYPNNF